MGEVSLDLFRMHVRTDDYTEDDALKQHYLDAAESAVTRTTQRTAEELRQKGGGAYPVELRQAIMLLAAHWYNQRESVSQTQMHEVPDSIRSLILPYRKIDV